MTSVLLIDGLKLSSLQIAFDVGVYNGYWRSTFVLVTAWTSAHKIFAVCRTFWCIW